MAERTFEWSDLRIFLAIAREGTLGAAARKLGVSQPTMGRRLRALEADVGETLFQRTGEGLVLTEEGTEILFHAERVEDETQALLRRLTAHDGQLGGMLRISSSDWFGATVLTPVLAEFGRLHPRVELELLTDARMYSLSRREADIAFRILPFREPDVVSRRLLTIEYGVYLQNGVAEPRPLDGTGARLVTMNTAFEDMTDAVWLRRLLPNATVAARSNNRDVQARLCSQGAGLAVLPRILGDRLAGVRRLDLGEPPPSRDTFIGFHRDLRRLARLRSFVELVTARLGPERPKRKPRAVGGPEQLTTNPAGGLRNREERSRSARRTRRARRRRPPRRALG
jgi:DNA-binding transcriptional LysR family regulator